MTKIANHVFQSFFAAYSLIKASRFRAYWKRQESPLIGTKRTRKRLKKITLKIKIQNHQCKGLWTWISTLIHSTYKHKPKPNHKDKQVAPQTKKQTCIFLKKAQNSFHSFSVLQGLKTIPIACLHIHESFPIKITSPNLKNW